MEEVNTQAVTPTEAPVTESASVEASTESNSVQASEKTETTQENTQDVQSIEKGDESPMVPKSRMDDYRVKYQETQERLNQLESDLREKERLANMTPDEVQREAQMKTAKEALKKVGLVDQEAVQQMVDQKLQEEKMRNWFVSEMNRLETEHDGKDGMPPFKAQEVAAFMDSKGLNDPEMAYKIMHFDSITEAKAKASKGTAYSEKPSGGVKELTDSRSADLEAASKAGDIGAYIKKYIGPGK